MTDEEFVTLMNPGINIVKEFEIQFLSPFIINLLRKLEKKYMACNCLNEEGQPTQMCRGTCNKLKAIINNQHEEQIRDPMNGFAELILSQVDKLIAQRMDSLRIEFQKEQFDMYKKAFIEGLEVGLRNN
jgi:hypothetical protein